MNLTFSFFLCFFFSVQIPKSHCTNGFVFSFFFLLSCLFETCTETKQIRLSGANKWLNLTDWIWSCDAKIVNLFWMTLVSRIVYNCALLNQLSICLMSICIHIHHSSYDVHILYLSRMGMKYTETWGPENERSELYCTLAKLHRGILS